MSVRSRVRRGGLGEDEEGAGASGGRPHDQANGRLSVPHYRKAPPVSDPCASKLASAALDMRTGCGQQKCTHSSSTFVSQPQNQLCRSSQVTCVGAILTPPHPLSLALNPTISMQQFSSVESARIVNTLLLYNCAYAAKTPSHVSRGSSQTLVLLCHF